MEIIKSGINYSKIGWFPKDHLENGKLPKEIFEEVARKGYRFQEWLEEQKTAADGKESPYFGMTLEEMHRKRWELRKQGQPVPLRAFEEMLSAADLKVFSPYSDVTVEKFYMFSDTVPLFVEYISDRVYASKIKASLVNEFVATTTVVPQGNEIKKIMLDDTEGDRNMSEVAKGSELPVKYIRVGKHTLAMKKFGLNIRMAYEDIRWQRVNVFGVALDRIGLEMGVQETDDVFAVAIAGDGNSNTPGTTVTPATANTIEMADAIEWWTGMPTPYVMDKHVSRKAIAIKYFTVLADLNIPLTTFQQNVGVNVPRHFEWDRSAVTTGYFIGFDTRYAMEHFSSGAVMTETDKIIQKQLQDTTVSIWSCNSVIDNQAIALWNTTSSG